MLINKKRISNFVEVNILGLFPAFRWVHSFCKKPEQYDKTIVMLYFKMSHNFMPISSFLSLHVCFKNWNYVNLPHFKCNSFVEKLKIIIWIDQKRYCIFKIYIFSIRFSHNICKKYLTLSRILGETSSQQPLNVNRCWSELKKI